MGSDAAEKLQAAHENINSLQARIRSLEATNSSLVTDCKQQQEEMASALQRFSEEKARITQIAQEIGLHVPQLAVSKLVDWYCIRQDSLTGNSYAFRGTNGTPSRRGKDQQEQRREHKSPNRTRACTFLLYVTSGLGLRPSDASTLCNSPGHGARVHKHAHSAQHIFPTDPVTHRCTSYSLLRVHHCSVTLLLHR